jgi:tetratricopeptide (TPR) repeat protein
MISGISALAIDAMFSFPTERIEHSMYMFLMAAILISNFIKTFPRVETKSFNSFYALSLALISCFGLFIGIKKYQFEENLPIAVAYDKAGKNDIVLAAVEKGNNDFVTVNEEGKSLQVYSSLAYLNTKNYAQALSESAIALKYNPNSAMVFNNMGAIYANMNKYDSASIYYQKALQIKPKFEEVIKNLAGCFYNLKAYDSCIATLQKLDISGDKYLLQLKQDAILLKGMALKDTSINK